MCCVWAVGVGVLRGVGGGCDLGGGQPRDSSAGIHRHVAESQWNTVEPSESYGILSESVVVPGESPRVHPESM